MDPKGLAYGSTLQFTPDHSDTYEVTFTTEGITHKLPIIGWAVVLQNYDYDGGFTAIEPVVIDDDGGVPIVMHQYAGTKDEWAVTKVELNGVGGKVPR